MVAVIQPGRFGAAPLFEYKFPGADGDAWDSSKFTSFSTSGSGTTTTISSGTGKVHITAGGYSGAWGKFNMTPTADVDIYAEWFVENSNRAWIGLVARVSGFDASGRPINAYGWRLDNSGLGGKQLMKWVSGTDSLLGRVSWTPSNNTWYGTRFQVIGSTVRGRMWALSGSEPSTWDVSTTDSAVSAANPSGFACSGDNTARTVDLHYDNIRVIPGV